MIEIGDNNYIHNYIIIVFIPTLENNYFLLLFTVWNEPNLNTLFGTFWDGSQVIILHDGTCTSLNFSSPVTTSMHTGAVL